MTDNAQSPEHSSFRTLQPLLTTQRLAPYVAAARGNEKLALQLYQWNIEVSGATHEALHVFEVVFRNTIDAQLANWNAAQTDTATGYRFSHEWLLDPAPLLRRLVRQSELDNARARAERAVRRHKRAPLHGDLLAQLSMGTWRFLLPDRDPGRQYLWDHALSKGSRTWTALPDRWSRRSTVSTVSATVSRTLSRCSDRQRCASSTRTCATCSATSTPQPSSGSFPSNE